MRSLLTVSHANSSRAKLCGASCNKVAVSSNLRQVPALNGLWAARRSSNAVFVHDRADRNPPGICRFLLARQALTRFFLSLTRGLSLPLISLGTEPRIPALVVIVASRYIVTATGSRLGLVMPNGT